MKQNWKIVLSPNWQVITIQCVLVAFLILDAIKYQSYLLGSIAFLLALIRF